MRKAWNKGMKFPNKLCRKGHERQSSESVKMGRCYMCVREKGWRRIGINNLTFKKFNDTLKLQNFKCYFCPRTLTVLTGQAEHDHITHEFRSVVCRRCNLNMGWLEKNHEHINSYLNRTNNSILSLRTGNYLKDLTPKQRKEYPIFEGVISYFPDALIEVAHVSFVGNEQHNPGQPLHWDRNKSTDEADALVRHLIQSGTLDSDGTRHTSKVAWRALALLQKEIENEAK